MSDEKLPGTGPPVIICVWGRREANGLILCWHWEETSFVSRNRNAYKRGIPGVYERVSSISGLLPCHFRLLISFPPSVYSNHTHTHKYNDSVTDSSGLPGANC